MSQSILVRQIPEQGLSFQLWPAAVALCEFLEAALSDPREPPGHAQECPPSKNPLKGIRALEVGAGTGMAGIMAACLGADVMLTDLPSALPNLAANAELNARAVEEGGGSTRVCQLRWGEGGDVAALEGPLDLVLGADVVYHEHLFEPLVGTLVQLARREEELSSSRQTGVPRRGRSALLGALERKLKRRRANSSAIPPAQGEASCTEQEEEGEDVACAPYSGHDNDSVPTTDEDLCSDEHVGLVLLLAHVRRWGKDRRFFKLLQKQFLLKELDFRKQKSQEAAVRFFLLRAR